MKNNNGSIPKSLLENEETPVVAGGWPWSVQSIPGQVKTGLITTLWGIQTNFPTALSASKTEEKQERMQNPSICTQDQGWELQSQEPI